MIPQTRQPSSIASRVGQFLDMPVAPLEMLPPDVPQWQMLQLVSEYVVERSDPDDDLTAPASDDSDDLPSTPPIPLTQDDLALLDTIVNDCCHRFGYQRQRDDLLQEMVVRVLQSNHLARYDAAKGASRKTYLYRFVFHRFCNLYERDRRTVGRTDSIEHVKIPQQSVQDALPDHWLLGQLEAIAQQLQLGYPPETAAVYAREPLFFVGIVPWRHSSHADTWLLWRSHSTIFRLLCLGLQQQEIAAVLRLSCGNVCHRVEDIRDWPGVRQLHTMLHESL